MRGRQVLYTVVLTALVLFPLLPGVPYDLVSTAILACQYLVAALSLVLLVGMVGQISLAQAALIGMGAFVSSIATRKLGLQFPFTLLVGMGAGAATAAVIGVVALRVRGLFLAVATLIFAYVCDQYLFSQSWLVETPTGTSIPFQSVGRAGTLPFFDLGDAHVFYYPALALAITALYLVANLRDSRLGRAFAAIRGSEVAAASLGVNVTRFKLLGFACAGGLAGLAGAMALAGARTVSPEQFSFINSLYFLAIAVVGGLRSPGGAVASSLIYAVMVGELFFHYHKLADFRDLIAAAMLIVVLLAFRGGLGALPERLRQAWDRLWPHLEPRWSRLRAALPAGDGARPLLPAMVTTAPARLRAAVGDALRGLRRAAQEAAPAAPLDLTGMIDRATEHSSPVPAFRLVGADGADPSPEVAPGVSHEELMRAMADAGEIAGEAGPDGRRTPVLLSAEGIVVRFGGLTAVSDVSIQVGAGEIVGLIGPNGAGKTTLFNALLGLNSPAAGRVELHGQDVTGWEVHRRAALGVGRTFQILQLFGDLSVFDNLLVATHLQNRTGLWGALAASGGARRAEAAARARVTAVLKLMDLEDIADRRVTGLPFGTLRLIEVARTLVTGARLVCFDEPASGLDSTETEGLIRWFRFLRQIGVTLLVIEHDVGMVVRLCDHIYVLDQGRLLASGPPAQIQRDPAVIASYLGTAAEAGVA